MSLIWQKQDQQCCKDKQNNNLSKIFLFWKINHKGSQTENIFYVCFLIVKFVFQLLLAWWVGRGYKIRVFFYVFLTANWNIIVIYILLNICIIIRLSRMLNVLIYLKRLIGIVQYDQIIFNRKSFVYENIVIE